MKRQNFTFKNGRGDLLAGKIFSPAGNAEKGLLYCHGLFSNKDGRKISQIGPWLAEKGVEVMAFDFFCSGGSSGSFDDISLIKQADDIKYALMYLMERGIKKITLAGSSMGAAAALLYSSDKSALNSSLVLIAPPVNFKGLISRLTADKKPGKDGFTLIDGIEVNNRFFEELAEIDMKKAAGEINMPVLIFHGALDGVVDIGNAEYLAGAIKTRPLFITIKDGDHTLSRDPDVALIQEEILKWLNFI